MSKQRRCFNVEQRAYKEDVKTTSKKWYRICYESTRGPRLVEGVIKQITQYNIISNNLLLIFIQGVPKKSMPL
jgi:hypothetical protein